LLKSAGTDKNGQQKHVGHSSENKFPSANPVKNGHSESIFHAQLMNQHNLDFLEVAILMGKIGYPIHVDPQVLFKN
jgi:hypothetical protein